MFGIDLTFTCCLCGSKIGHVLGSAYLASHAVIKA